ncbi:hypothetical protein [Burkholderia lata]|uniref:hypothetical protein n=1 Tax=Burkholderia lata (strain ATCC 17760 / DSM 23089 / LMG 22485 / NCIMB 9086 / R18194 / 383) TaxID=482957 RepID=UPI0015835C78|nr:hypothetical protein [Burkholderia lata]
MAQALTAQPPLPGAEAVASRALKQFRQIVAMAADRKIGELPSDVPDHAASRFPFPELVGTIALDGFA